MSVSFDEPRGYAAGYPSSFAVSVWQVPDGGQQRDTWLSAVPHFEFFDGGLEPYRRWPTALPIG